MAPRWYGASSVERPGRARLGGQHGGEDSTWEMPASAHQDHRRREVLLRLWEVPGMSGRKVYRVEFTCAHTVVVGVGDPLPSTCPKCGKGKFYQAIAIGDEDDGRSRRGQ